VEEIVGAAGVTKGTFYFHFAHKEEILLEVAYGTAEALYEQAEAGVASGMSDLALLRRLLNSLARRVGSVPRAAVQRTVSAFFAHGLPSHGSRLQMQDAFRLALEAARDAEELPADADVTEIAAVLQVLAMDAIDRWSSGDRRNLRTVLQRRAGVLLDGVRPAEPVPASKRRAATG
jgi:AcrR family transcriptional regulator